MTPRFPIPFSAALLVLCLAGQASALRTASAQEPVVPDPIPAQSEELPISARGALLRSFAIPGWGQSYAGAPGRGAFYFALEATSLWMVYKTERQLAASRVRDEWLRESGEVDVGEISGLTRARAQQFEDWVTISVFVALFSGADAYVTAQLSDFAENVQVRPVGGGSFEFGASVPVGRIR